jgi:hypothetical protein
MCEIAPKKFESSNQIRQLRTALYAPTKTSMHLGIARANGQIYRQIMNNHDDGHKHVAEHL